jgi:hypothetical protein
VERVERGGDRRGLHRSSFRLWPEGDRGGLSDGEAAVKGGRGGCERRDLRIAEALA